MKEAKFSVIIPGSQFSSAQIESFENTARRYNLPVRIPLRKDSHGRIVVSSGLNLRDAQMLRRQVSGMGYPCDVVSDEAASASSNDATQSSNTAVVFLDEFELNSIDPINEITADAWSSLEMPSLDLGLKDGSDLSNSFNASSNDEERTLSLSALDLIKAAQGASDSPSLGRTPSPASFFESSQHPGMQRLGDSVPQASRLKRTNNLTTPQPGNSQLGSSQLGIKKSSAQIPKLEDRNKSLLHSNPGMKRIGDMCDDAAGASHLNIRKSDPKLEKVKREKLNELTRKSSTAFAKVTNVIEIPSNMFNDVFKEDAAEPNPISSIEHSDVMEIADDAESSYLNIRKSDPKLEKVKREKLNELTRKSDSASAKVTRSIQAPDFSVNEIKMASSGSFKAAEQADIDEKNHAATMLPTSVQDAVEDSESSKPASKPVENAPEPVENAPEPVENDYWSNPPKKHIFVKLLLAAIVIALILAVLKATGASVDFVTPLLSPLF